MVRLAENLVAQPSLAVVGLSLSLVKTTVLDGWVARWVAGGWVDQLELRLTSTQLSLGLG